MGKEQKPASPAETKKQTKPESTHGTDQNQGQGQSHGSSRGNAAVTNAMIGCGAQGCKAKDDRFGFCSEHFRQFKFGLINKSGEPAFDYERKFDHYQKWKQAQKVA